IKVNKAKEIKKIKRGNQEYLLIQIEGQEFAFNFNNKELIPVCRKIISKEEFSGNINVDPNCLNIIEIEVPDKLKVKKVETNGKVEKKGNKLIIYTFSPVTIETESLVKVTNIEKKQYNVVKENQVPQENKSISVFTWFLFFVIFSLLVGSATSYYVYIMKKRAELARKKKYANSLYQQKLRKEMEEKRELSKLIKLKQQKLIEEEAKNLLSWVKFLLKSYDEKEVYNYLIRKGYKEEVVKKAFELYKKGKY
ncbi:MAG: hypothetical protein ABGW69_01905, partial [Nanoarchaeota archaeon]